MGVLDGKVAVVSGGARGMGAAHVRRFVAEGAQVVFGDVLEAESEALAKELGGAAHVVPLDVTLEDHWAGAVAYAKRELGGLHVLVNNAGIGAGTPIVGGPLDDYMRVIMINQVGVWLGMQHAAPVMGESGGGSIVNISSIDGISTKNGLVAYTSSKFAIRGMTRTAAIELGQYGIRVNSVHPGGVNTIMGNPFGVDEETINRVAYRDMALGRVGRPEEIAAMTLFLASDEASYCTGAEYLVDGGWLAGDTVAAMPGAPRRDRGTPP